jgi:hypothetical protein
LRIAVIETMRHFLLAICLLPATACSGNSPSGPTPIDQEVVLAPGQTAEFNSGLSVRFISVIGDSRCPIDAVCIWGGDAIVRIHIAAGTGRADRDLHSGNLEPVTFDDVEVRLVELTPYPFSGRDTPQGDYRATLRVIR